MDFKSFPWIASVAAIGAVIAATWRHVIGALRWIMDLVICRIVVKREAASAVMSYTWENSRRSPFGLRVFGGVKIFVNPVKRIEVVGYESISSDPLLFWFHGRPVLIGRRKYGENEVNTGEGNNNELHLIFIRRTFNAEKFVASAIEHFNVLHRAVANELGKPHRRFSIVRLGASPASEISGRNKSQATPLFTDNDEDFQEQIKTHSVRLLNWGFDDIGVRSEGASAFSGYAFPKSIMDALNEIQTWLDHEKWFRSKGIPWRRGWLLHGPPGTGKSTLIRSIAMEFDLPVYVLDLSSLDNPGLASAWQEVQQNAPAIALIEDIDSIFEGRENVSQQSALRNTLTFDCLLNTISGVNNSDGVFLFVTTNKIEKLDPALGIPKNGTSTRPGRIDRIIQLESMQETERRVIAENILSDFPGLVGWAVIQGRGETAAQFQDRCAQIALKEFWEAKNGNIKI